MTDWELFFMFSAIVVLPCVIAFIGVLLVDDP